MIRAELNTEKCEGELTSLLGSGKKESAASA